MHVVSCTERAHNVGARMFSKLKTARSAQEMAGCSAWRHMHVQSTGSVLQAQQALGIHQGADGGERTGKRLAGLGVGFKRMLGKNQGGPDSDPVNHFANETLDHQPGPVNKSR